MRWKIRFSLDYLLSPAPKTTLKILKVYKIPKDNTVVIFQQYKTGIIQEDKRRQTSCSAIYNGGLSFLAFDQTTYVSPIFPPVLKTIISA